MQVHYLAAIEQLQLMLQELAALAENAVLKSIKAVDELDVALADTIIVNDEQLDRSEIQIEEECLKILALYQPVAGDLRQVITILKINNEIERIGDMAVNIAERVADMKQYPGLSIANFNFGVMVNKAGKMLKEALDSMTYNNVAAAAGVIAQDDAVDELHRSNYQVIRELLNANPQHSGYYLDALTISRCLERIADAATNIAEDVVYLGSGKIVRHAMKLERN